MNELEQIRLQIDHIDQQMASLFEQRMKVVQQVVSYKKQHNLPILDISREKDILQKTVLISKTALLSLIIKLGLKKPLRFLNNTSKIYFNLLYLDLLLNQ